MQRLSLRVAKDWQERRESVRRGEGVERSGNGAESSRSWVTSLRRGDDGGIEIVVPFAENATRPKRCWLCKVNDSRQTKARDQAGLNHKIE